jgi:hypothetical protein
MTYEVVRCFNNRRAKDQFLHFGGGVLQVNDPRSAPSRPEAALQSHSSSHSIPWKRRPWTRSRLSRLPKGACMISD